MRTITFYSYKGGVGRSLLVANAAKYLSTLGKSVYALDLDLEAPGLHYKFELGRDAAHSPANVGIVDILVPFIKDGVLPNSLVQYTTELKVNSGAGAIRIMRAGTAPHGDYWRLLSQINWYDLFYGDNPIGAPFFLELKERVRSEFSPDFLLIDARTGITEMGGIATTLLPDTVVCLALDSFEHLEGLRAAMQGIKQTTSQEGAPVNLVAVISRLPHRNEEENEIESVKSFLNEPPVSGRGGGLGLTEIVALHAEPQLDSAEQLLVGGKSGPHELPLLRDYLRLFSKIIPAEDIRPHVGFLIQHATSRLLDDPDAAQSELEALTTYCADQEAYRALLKLYLLRKAPIEKLIATAATMWQLGGSSSSPDPFLFDIVRAGFTEPRPPEIQKKYAAFAEAVWRSAEMKDIQIGMTIVGAYLPERRQRAVELLTDYIDRIEKPSLVAIVRLVDLLRQNSPRQALSIVDRFKETVRAPDFYVAWAKVALNVDSAAAAQQILLDPSFDIAATRSADAGTAYRLLRMAGEEVPVGFLQESIDTALDAQNYAQLISLGEVLEESGRADEFDALAVAMRKRLPTHIAEDLLERIRMRRRSPRYIGRSNRF
jgi:hypothetical protein